MYRIVMIFIGILVCGSMSVFAEESENQDKVYYVTDNTVAWISGKTGVSTEKATFFADHLVLSEGKQFESVFNINDKVKKGISAAISTLDETFFSKNQVLKNSKVQEIEVYIDAGAEGSVKIFGGSIKSGIKVKMISKA